MQLDGTTGRYEVTSNYDADIGRIDAFVPENPAFFHTMPGDVRSERTITFYNTMPGDVRSELFTTFK